MKYNINNTIIGLVVVLIIVFVMIYMIYMNQLNPNQYILKSGDKAYCPEGYSNVMNKEQMINMSSVKDKFCTPKGVCNICLSKGPSSRRDSNNGWIDTDWDEDLHGRPMGENEVTRQMAYADGTYIVDPLSYKP